MEWRKALTWSIFLLWHDITSNHNSTETKNAINRYRKLSHTFLTFMRVKYSNSNIFRNPRKTWLDETKQKRVIRFLRNTRKFIKSFLFSYFYYTFLFSMFFFFFVKFPQNSSRLMTPFLYDTHLQNLIRNYSVVLENNVTIVLCFMGQKMYKFISQNTILNNDYHKLLAHGQVRWWVLGKESFILFFLFCIILL